MRTCGSVIVALDVGYWMLVSHDFAEWRNSAGYHGRDDGRSTSENKEADRSRVRGTRQGERSARQTCGARGEETRPICWIQI